MGAIKVAPVAGLDTRSSAQGELSIIIGVGVCAVAGLLGAIARSQCNKVRDCINGSATACFGLVNVCSNDNFKRNSKNKIFKVSC